MNKVLKFLLPDAQQRCSTAAFLLVARVVFALLLASHGLQKLEGFEQMSGGFPDPLGLGSALSLSLTIFGELVCSLALVVGVLSKLALLPMIFTMCVAFFMAHGGSIGQDELAFVYLVVFVLLFFAGPGRFSVDGWLAKKLDKQARRSARRLICS